MGNGKIKLNMKLIYLHQYFNFPEHSGGTRSYDLSREFVKKGIDVTVVTSSASMGMEVTKRWTYYEREGITTMAQIFEQEQQHHQRKGVAKGGGQKPKRKSYAELAAEMDAKEGQS